jgi:hypothetical protein
MVERVCGAWPARPEGDQTTPRPPTPETASGSISRSPYPIRATHTTRSDNTL